MSLDNTVKNNLIDQQNSENNMPNSDSMSISELEELKAKEERRQNSLKNLRPLKPDSECTPEEIEYKREVCRKGAIGRNLQAAKERSMKESAKQLLKTKVSQDYAKKVLGEDAEIDGITTMQDLMLAKMMREVIENGNAKAFELVRDTSGNKPTAELEVRADVVTASDRALIDKVADRLGLVNITDEDETENR